MNWIASIAQRFKRFRARQRSIRLMDILRRYDGETAHQSHLAAKFPGHCDRSGGLIAVAASMRRHRG